MYCGDCEEKDKIISQLNEIGIALSAEKDVERLIEIILEESMKLTKSDAGSIYFKEKNETGEFLRFKITRNNSKSFPFQEFLLPLDCNSIAGCVGATGVPLNFNDVNEIPGYLDLKYNAEFDKKVGYNTVNMLTIPMKSYEGEIVGVIQLINKKRDYTAMLKFTENENDEIIPYTKSDEQIVFSLASQASILLQRTKLLVEIEKLFESFIETMVATIDSRDSTTAGHSKRLSDYAIRFAEAINRVNYGKFKDFSFSEEQIKQINYAALLHDIGKISICEKVLLKADRLTEENIQLIKYRFKYIKKHFEFKKHLNSISCDEEIIYSKLDEYCEKICSINKSGFLKEQEELFLNNIFNTPPIIIDGETIELLTGEEMKNLSVRYGNLTDEEKIIMNLHVDATRRILNSIYWPSELCHVIEIASQHHEKLNGSGYPKGISGDDIMLEARMLAIIDIFEALTAKNRPYKKAVTPEKAMEILKKEVVTGALDKELFEIFYEERVYEC